MKLWGVAMVRNESDIIEAFVRHNLTLLDGLAIVDHRSADDTMKILTTLAREGLPLMVLANDAVAYAQKEIMTSALRHVLARTPADFVFPLDADEFIKAPSRAHMERVLAAMPAGAHGLMHWPTYVPDFDLPWRGIVACAKSARRVVEERHEHGKVIVARRFASTPRALLAGGNHAVMPWFGATPADLDPHHLFALEDLALAHLPHRSAQQFVVKIVINRLARIAVGRDLQPNRARLHAYERICAGLPVDAQFIRAMTINFGITPDKWIDPDDARLVDDPFLADVVLRYTPAEQTPPLPLVLTAVEQLAQREAAARASAPASAPASTPAAA
ncbi:MAG: glycosyltransferase family 2 protein [Betaproteobacteria bacterium]